MKGFIEITVDRRRVLIALSAIVGVNDRGSDGCLLSLSAAIAGFSDGSPMTHVQQDYDDILALIEAAQ